MSPWHIVQSNMPGSLTGTIHVDVCEIEWSLCLPFTISAVIYILHGMNGFLKGPLTSINSTSTYTKSV